MTAADIRPGHRRSGIQATLAGSEQDTRHAIIGAPSKPETRGGSDIPDGHIASDAHGIDAVGEQTPEPTKVFAIPTDLSSARAQDTATATQPPVPIRATPLPSDTLNGQSGSATHRSTAVEGATSASPAILDAPPIPHAPVLADPTLALLADVLDDLERTRIANENRLRQLTRTGVDKDGEERGFGLTEDHPDVARLAGVVQGIAALEHQATLNLNRVMRAHPLGPWVKAQLGVGEKQAARLLASIGDPYWNTLYDRPRTVSELWAYCGLHVIRIDQGASEAQCGRVGAEQPGNPDHARSGAQTKAVGVAARRRKGEKANWSTAAKMRAWNIAGSMLKAGNRDTYDKRKAATEGCAHAVPCVRCGPSGKPAPPGSPWSDGHRHADALRIVSKALLRDLWLAARDIHLGHLPPESHDWRAEVEEP